MLTKTYVSVPSFYAGKSVFITGGTGYLGKVLIEKLVYSCPQVNKIYVLLREKKSISAEQRFKNMLDKPLFSRIKTERPMDLNKIVVIKGELTAPSLNLSPQDFQIIRDNVSIVLHSAATVKFNEPLKEAMAINVEGTRNVLELCKQLRRVDAFVHVSTAYSNCNRSVIEEVIYPAPAAIDEVYRVVEQGTDDDVTAILDGLPNTYTFTKALAENLVQSTHGDVPAIIVRPSIVTGSKTEPLPGWVDNWFGPTGIMTPAAMGICRALYSQYDYNLDIIPVDYVCNTILVAATKAQRCDKVTIFNAVSGSTNPISTGDSLKYYIDAGLKDKFNLLPFPHLILYTKREWILKLILAVMYMIVYIADFILQVARKKPRFEKIFSNLVAVQKVASFFTSRSWLMKSPNTLALTRSLSPEDAQLFPFNPQDIEWKEYIPIYYRGVKKYLIEAPK